MPKNFKRRGKTANIKLTRETVSPVFTVPNGTEFHLRPLPPLFLERLVNEDDWKPLPEDYGLDPGYTIPVEVEEAEELDDGDAEPIPPMETVQYRGGFEDEEPNPDDADYKAALAKWQMKKNYKMSFFILTMGIVEECPPEFWDEYGEFFPHARTPSKRKYIWITVQITDDKVLAELMDAIIGQTEVTEDGLKDAEDEFRLVDQRG